MKIGFIAHGELPIPPESYGAVENGIWWKKVHLERMGHTVDIANTRQIHEVIHTANQRGYDFIHCHSELFVLPCVAHLRCPFAVTSHHGGLHRFDPAARERGGLWYLFADTLAAPANFVLSERIRDAYLRAGYDKFLRVVRNAVEAEQFRFAPRGNGRAICLGAVTRRKRQAWLAEAIRGHIAVDFVGPREPGESEFAEHAQARHLGVWDKKTLYERLTDYSCLVLASHSEATPRVAIEALAAGLSLVLTDACAGHLTAEPFITVIRDEELRPERMVEALRAAIEANDAQREAIRAYAHARFAYEAVMPEYLRSIEELRETYVTAPRA